MPLFLLLFIVTSPLFAVDSSNDYARGKTLYFQKGCNNCHGSRAEGTGNFPYLANRAKGFLAYKLKSFRKGTAENARQEMMVGFAVGLTDDEINAMTTFLSDYRDESTERYDSEFQTWGDGGS